MTVYVEDGVFDAIAEVRQEGRFNMLNRRGVMGELNQKAKQSEPGDTHYDSAIVWLNENKDEYTKAIFEGLEPESDRESEADAEIDAEDKVGGGL